MMDSDYGLYVWPSAIVLSHYLYHDHYHSLRDKRVLELGAGTSLVGLLASALGAKVTLTDRADTPQLMTHIRNIISLNETLYTVHKPTLIGFNWGDFTLEIMYRVEVPDVILGADIMYDEDGSVFIRIHLIL
jgi:predicted nicotinamide N-methyase